MWTHEAAIRLRIAFDQLAAVNAETFGDLPIDKGRLMSILGELREMAVAMEARRPNPGLYTGFILDAAGEADTETRDGVAWASIQVPHYTAERFLKEMGRKVDAK